MRDQILKLASAAFALIHISSALPSQLNARQSIDFDLVDSTPDPVIEPDNTTNFNPAAAIASVIAEVKENPLPQTKRSIEGRDIVVNTYPGYSVNQAIGNAAINAPLDCNQRDTYMGVKLFTTSAFDTALCAAACTAQSQYNTAYPPRDRPAETCQFYNTYALYKNDEYQGQYCSLYNQTWAASYATNTGQWRGNDHYTIQNSFVASNATNPGVCPAANAQPPPTPQVPTDPPLDLTKVQTFVDPPDQGTVTVAPNLVTMTRNSPIMIYIRHFFPTVPGTIYEITLDYFIDAGSQPGTDYRLGAGDPLLSANANVGWTDSLLRFDEGYSTANIGPSGPPTASCIKAKYQPRTIPVKGQWNTAKIVLRAQSKQGVFIMDSRGRGGMQWRNIYIRAQPITYCD